MRKSVIGIVILCLVLLGLFIALVIATSCTTNSKATLRDISDSDIDRSMEEQ